MLAFRMPDVREGPSYRRQRDDDARCTKGKRSSSTRQISRPPVSVGFSQITILRSVCQSSREVSRMKITKSHCQTRPFNGCIGTKHQSLHPISCGSALHERRLRPHLSHPSSQSSLPVPQSKPWPLLAYRSPVTGIYQISQRNPQTSHQTGSPCSRFRRLLPFPPE